MITPPQNHPDFDPAFVFRRFPEAKKNQPAKAG
jgi:hypothetical protein